MRNRIILYILLIFVFITTQVTILNFVRIFGITPNLIIILIVSISLLEGRVNGATMGFFAGLCLDAVVGIALGYNALFGMLLGIGLGNINKRFYKENALVMAISTFISTILYETAIMISSNLIYSQAHYMEILKAVVLPEAAINAVLGVILFLGIVFISRRLIETEGKNRY